jgi:hypothetical protein
VDDEPARDRPPRVKTFELEHINKENEKEEKEDKKDDEW